MGAAYFTAQGRRTVVLYDRFMLTIIDTGFGDNSSKHNGSIQPERHQSVLKGMVNRGRMSQVRHYGNYMQQDAAEGTCYLAITDMISSSTLLDGLV